ncbi:MULTISPECIES: tonB-system energizer ExbB [Rhizobium/Agrobacterium group]|uniref:tonB-system energizer ExbB n=1 Tax=Rhizobium/Agrobacterium group TaxID=227290 RepID=UPI000B4026D9|nr:MULTISPECIES: tonB-system energizer ExbB [Rhizobium/Agrobacterium group]MCF1484973.1 tonB-system energizer ExbB [Allorhizobium ampelinum]MVA53626.1 tonB-system energizer ExbB [Agrobacterium vitis]NSZ45363.1 tonB-system energizer ExbB [Agrobacterium vitis]NSZ55167.1 tonB-system energizer ExbB [Agrobacterium vitis]NTA29110.1 tonB-system energizer ExbB [Allorhizobium ampelinum]
MAYRRSSSLARVSMTVVIGSGLLITGTLMSSSAALAQQGTAPAQTTSEPAPATPAQTPVQETPAATTNLTAPPAENGTPAPAPSPTEGVAVDAPAAVQRSDIPHDLSPVGMFMAADWVVKSVMIALGLASVATWTILLVKTLQLSGSKARLRRGLAVLQEARSLSQAAGALQKRRGTVPDMLLIAARELKLSEPALDYAGNDGVKERVSSALSRIESRAGRRMTAGTGILATIGSIGPFVGLFGTVWGIMNSFIGISQSQTTNLAVVAPGIAEALLATAIGLVAAIPAVVIYNVFARAVTGYRQQLLDAATAVERLVSRDLDFRKVPADVRAARLKVVTE